MANFTKGNNCIISDGAEIGDEVIIKDNCIIEEGAKIGAGTYIDSNTIIRSNANIGEKSFIGAGCIIAEYLMDFCLDRKQHSHPLIIGSHALIRSGSILYAGSLIGNNFQTGHRVTIREGTSVGHDVSIGTLSDIQGQCSIGDYCRIHSNVHVGQLTQIDNFVWIYPYVVITNDQSAPSDNILCNHICNFSVIATKATVAPGLTIGSDAFICADTFVCRNVDDWQMVMGNPGRVIQDIRNIKDKITGEQLYPWRIRFDRYMPWEGIGYNKWYENLEQEEKNLYGI